MLNPQHFLTDSLEKTATEVTGIELCMINVLQAGAYVGSIKSQTTVLPSQSLVYHRV